ncbi:MAG: CvpA family protein, partial [Chloroflexota bacterium]
MTIGTTDIFLLVIIVSTLVVGFFWGALRSLALLAAWVLIFITGSYLKTELGSYLASEWGQFSAQYNDMAAFGIIFVGLLLAAPFVIFFTTRGGQRLTRYQ